MDDITVIHHEGDDFAILIRDHVIHVDQPYHAGGMNGGPAPVELFVASLAACAAHYGRRYLTRRGLPGEGLEVGPAFTMSAGPPAGVARVRLKVHPPAGLSAEHRTGMFEAIEGCPVHHSLRRPPAIDIDIEPYSQVA